MPTQPDPLSPQAQAILDAPDQPRLTGELTIERAQAIRESQAQARRPVVDRVAAELGVTAAWHTVGGVKVVRVEAAEDKRRAFRGSDGPDGGDAKAAPQALFLHGGGFTGGLAHDMSSVLNADALGIPVWSVDYSLAPEAVFPTAVDEVESAYRVLTQQFPGLWVVFGVSAGGNLALALTQRLLAAGDPVPAALGLYSPWTDLTGAGDSRTGNDGRDPVLRWPEQLPVAVDAYAAGAPLDDPLVSPIFATFDGFPPTLITTGTRDLFLSDCTRLHWALRRAEVPVELRVWENLWHAFNTQHAVPEAAEARAEMAGFLLRHV